MLTPPPVSQAELPPDYINVSPHPTPRPTPRLRPKYGRFPSDTLLVGFSHLATLCLNNETPLHTHCSGCEQNRNKTF